VNDPTSCRAADAPRQLHALTALRFPCAAMIVLVHANAYFDFVDFHARIQLTQGVSFFFVLSGFILAYHYDRPGRRPWKSFYVARFARIFPAHLAALGLFFVLSDYPLGQAEGVVLRTATLGSNLLLVQSWIPLQPFFFGYNAVAWSLSTEVGFCLFFPLLLGRGSDSLPWRILFVTAAMAAAFVAIGWWARLTLHGGAWSPSLLGLVLVNPLARMFEFALGIFFCAVYRRGWHAGATWWAIAECGVIVFALGTMVLCAEPRLAFLPPAIGFYLVWSGSALPFAFVVLVFAASDGPIARLLSTRLPVLLGQASFSLYLVHQPVLAFIASRHLLPNDSVVALGLYFVASIAVALLLFACIETPVRRWIVERGSPGRAGRVVFG
jgi:peptidoglycan/LPS O-acetylase OafA/YrhL